MFIKANTNCMVLILSLFLCQSGVCAQLIDALSQKNPAVQCHGTSHEMTHENGNNKGSDELKIKFEPSNCCYESSLNATNFNSKSFSLYELKYSQHLNLIISSGFKNSMVHGKGHSPPGIYVLNSSYLI